MLMIKVLLAKGSCKITIFPFRLFVLLHITVSSSTIRSCWVKYTAECCVVTWLSCWAAAAPQWMDKIKKLVQKGVKKNALNADKLPQHSHLFVSLSLTAAADQTLPLIGCQSWNEMTVNEVAVVRESEEQPKCPHRVGKTPLSVLTIASLQECAHTHRHLDCLCGSEWATAPLASDQVKQTPL